MAQLGDFKPEVIQQLAELPTEKEEYERRIGNRPVASSPTVPVPSEPVVPTELKDLGSEFKQLGTPEATQPTAPVVPNDNDNPEPPDRPDPEPSKQLEPTKPVENKPEPSAKPAGKKDAKVAQSPAPANS
jgi:hypothetical protein